MRIADLIGPEHVLLDLPVASKAQLLQVLARRSAAAVGIDERTILAALEAREQLGSTGLGKGFALPHARLAALASPFALFARLVQPIDFAAVDDGPVDIVVLLLTPLREASQHLSVLAAVSRPMRNDSFVQRLRRTPDAGALYSELSSV